MSLTYFTLVEQQKIGTIQKQSLLFRVAHFSGLQLVSFLQEIWNNCLKQKSENTSLLVFEDHHLIRGLRFAILEKSNFQRVVLCVNF